MKYVGRKSILIGALLCLVLLAATPNCKKSDTLDPAGRLLQAAGCKQSQAENGPEGLTLAKQDDCLEYHYDGANTLILNHINAGFNCCPGTISATIEFNGNLVVITEKEQEQGCKCNCLYDLDFEITDLAPGQYTIRVVEPYLQTGDTVLEFTIDLSGSTSGNFCLPRNYYPWD